MRIKARRKRLRRREEHQQLGSKLPMEQHGHGVKRRDKNHQQNAKAPDFIHQMDVALPADSSGSGQAITCFVIRLTKINEIVLIFRIP